MLERLTEGFQSALRNLSGQGAISEKNVRDAMAEVRESLLEADVALEVVEQFCDEVVQDALGQKVTESVKPGEEMIKIVHDELVRLLGGDEAVEAAEQGDAYQPGTIASEQELLFVSHSRQTLRVHFHARWWLQLQQDCSISTIMWQWRLCSLMDAK